MKVNITKKEKFIAKDGKGEASIIYATTSKGTNIMFYDYQKDGGYSGASDKRKNLYPVDPWEFYESYQHEGIPRTYLFGISDFELVSSEDIEEESDIGIAEYQFHEPTVGWRPGKDIQEEYEKRYKRIYQEIGEAYDLERIGEFETYCPSKYQKMLQRESLDEEQKNLIKKLAKSRAYCNSEEVREKIDENIEKFITGKAIFAVGTTYSQGYDTVLDDMSAIDSEDMKKIRDEFLTGFTSFTDFERHPGDSAWPWGHRRDIVKIISLGEKQIELPGGRKYNGTFGAHDKCWDVIIGKDSRPEIWNYRFLPCERFDVEDGNTEKYEKYNEVTRKEKERRVEFYKSVMQDVQETFGLSEEQAKILLKYAGTVTAFGKAAELGKAGVSGQELMAIARKISYDGVSSISERVANEFNVRLDTFQDAASTLQYLDYLLGGEENRKTIVRQKITFGEIKKATDKHEKEYNSYDEK